MKGIGMNIKYKKINKNAVTPLRATKYSAGADLHACIDKDITIEPMQRVMIPTGLAFAIENGYGGFVYARSGTASKFGITLSNCVGVIDSDYRGELKIPVINLGTESYTVKNGDRIAQLVIMPVELAKFSEALSLDETERSDGGFGSTGKN